MPDSTPAFFRRLTLKDWRQFAALDIDLSDRICVLTGPNGCGKTTILNVLGRHFGWNVEFSDLLRDADDTGEPILSHGQLDRMLKREVRPGQEVGSIEYSTGDSCALSMPRRSSRATYSLSYSDRIRDVPGIFIPSHSPAIIHAPVKNIPADPLAAAKQYQAYNQVLLATHKIGLTAAKLEHPATVLKRSLISLALFGTARGPNVRRNRTYSLLFDVFQDTLRILLPKQLGFRGIVVDSPDVFIDTSSGMFPIDSMSGGIAAVVQIAWQLHMYGADKPAFTAVIDEPENHLHPEMQRLLLPSLAEAFPRCRFIVATHSPFIVTAMPDACVFALEHIEGRIVSRRIDRQELSGTPEKVMRDILDVPTTLPIWVEDRIKAVIEHSAKMPANAQSEFIYNALSELGLTQHIGLYVSKAGQ
jgi:predicted ATPase